MVERPSIICPRCEMTSFHPDDVKNEYCGACHLFHDQMGVSGEERLTILANSNVSRGKFAAAAVHAALLHYGIEHGAVIVLGSKPGEIEEQCTSVVRDAGRTEVEPGTVTAGVQKHS